MRGKRRRGRSVLQNKRAGIPFWMSAQMQAGQEGLFFEKKPTRANPRPISGEKSPTSSSAANPEKEEVKTMQ